MCIRDSCYTGQEIVARMQYLGKLKRRLQRLRLVGSELPAVGSELFSPVHGSSVGEVVLAAQAGDAIELLAVLQDDAVNAVSYTHLDVYKRQRLNSGPPELPGLIATSVWMNGT